MSSEDDEGEYFMCEVCPNMKIKGTNCAYSLSRAEGWKTNDKDGYYCYCHIPVKALFVRNNFFGPRIDSNKAATDHAFIYCQKGGWRHVYYGTYSTCVKGNGYTAEEMDGINGNQLSVFDRHRAK